MRHPSPEKPATPIPEFDPVPVRARRDGWTPDRQRAFIAALAATHCIDRAAATVGLSRESVYRLRRHPEAGSFADAWLKVLAAKPSSPRRVERLFYRAVHGKVRPIVRGGKVVGTLHQPDNKALMSMIHLHDQADRSRARARARRERRDRGGDGDRRESSQ